MQESAEAINSYKLSDYSRLLAFNKGQLAYHAGHCRLAVIAGSINLDGFMIEPRKWYTIITSSVSAARILSASTQDMKSPNKSTQSFLRTNKIDLDFIPPLFLNDLSIGCVCIIEGFPSELSNEWLWLAEGFDPGEASTVSASSNVSKSDCVDVKSALIATSTYMLNRGIDMFTIKPSWRANLQAVVAEIRTSTGIDNPNVKILICGSKGVGKSSFLRYTVNKLLSICPRVCVIDCDAGQPEFTSPGFLSLNVVTEPIFSPCHLNLQTPELQYFIGDVTTKNNPNQFSQLIRLLLNRYYEREQFYKQLHLKLKQNIKPSLYANNIYSKFVEEEQNEIDGWLERRSVLLPLVVNTDGNVRYMGEEILNAVIQASQPTHIFHISTERDHHLAPVHQYVLSHRNPFVTTATADSTTIGTPLTYQLPVKLYSLEPGTYGEGRVKASDLRTLRLVSYFLRSSPYMILRVREMIKSKRQNIVSSSKIDSGSTESATSIETNTCKPPFYIRNGVITDIHGWLAVALSMAPTAYAPFSSLVYSLPMSDLPSRLFPAAFNISIAGLVPISNEATQALDTSNLEPPTSSVHATETWTVPSPSLHCTNTGRFKFQTASLQPNRIQKIAPAGTRSNLALDTIAMSQSLEIEIGYSYEQPNLPCTGLCVVRAFDMTASTVLLSLPYPQHKIDSSPNTTEKAQSKGSSNLNSISKKQKSTGEPIYCDNSDPYKMALVRAKFPIPLSLLHCPYFPTSSYMSSEVDGEGAKVMRARKNLKRR